MRFYLHIFICVTLLFSMPAFAQNQKMQNAPGSFADLVEDLLPAVVNISSTQKVSEHQNFPDMPQFPEGSPFQDFFEEFMDRRGRGIDQAPPSSLGSGFIIDAKNGYVVTNNHVIRDADEVRVVFQNDETVEAEIIGYDEKTDIAVLKIDSEGRNLKEVPFGDSKVMRVGDWVVAIGNPFGLGGTVTKGIISARQRDIQSGPYDDFIQTDASINRGNSGGPMFNLNGEVIGINTAIFSPTGGSVGIGFAIPSDLAQPVIRQLIEYGRTRRGWLGVRIQSVTEEIAESLELKDESGALVASITPDGPAEKAGLEHGDVILRFAGKDINEMRTLPRTVAETPIGDTVDVVVWREGAEVTLKVTVEELEKAEEEGLLETSSKTKNDADDIDALGLSIKPLSDLERDEFAIPQSIDGILIANVDPSSEASRKGILEGDVVVEINQQAINTPQDMIDIVKDAQKSGRRSILLLVNRSGDIRFVALRVGE